MIVGAGWIEASYLEDARVGELLRQPRQDARRDQLPGGSVA